MSKGKKFMTTREGDKTRAALKRIAKRSPIEAPSGVNTEAAKTSLKDMPPQARAKRRSRAQEGALEVASVAAQRQTQSAQSTLAKIVVTVKGKQIGASDGATQITHKPTRAQEIMIADGLPRALALSGEQRALIRKHAPPPKALPRFDAPQREEHPQTTAFREALECQQAIARQRASETSPFLAAKRAERANRAPRPSREGLTTVGDIAKALGIPPRIARAMLRAAKEKKPAQGWAFDAKEAQRITNVIKEQMKCQSSAKPTTAKAKSSKSKSTVSPAKPRSPSKTSSKSSKPAKKSSPRAGATSKRKRK